MSKWEKMGKKSLNEMSFEELGRLFPIIISDYNPDWPFLYAAEKELIILATGAESTAAIDHIGSTAVKGLKAKPTIDILLQIKNETDLTKLKTAITGIGYEFSYQKNNPPPHMTFMKGYTLDGFKGQSYHLHVRYKGEWDELIFRDYLRRDAAAREQYERLKLKLQKKFEFDREGYTQAKGGFIRAAVEKVKASITNPRGQKR